MVELLRITNFKGIRHLELDLTRSPVTVLIGENGAGKSSVLEATAHLLAQLLADRLDHTILKGLKAGPDLIRTGADEAQLAGRFRWVHGERFAIELGIRPTGKHRTTLSYDDIPVSPIPYLERQSVWMPAIAYYPVRRHYLEGSKKRYKPGKSDPRMALYDRPFDRDRATFDTFFEWFRDREDQENERIRSAKDLSYRDRQLEAVRHAIGKVLDGLSNLRVLRVEDEPRFIITKGSIDLDLFQLSDGERALLALAGDLARHMAQANPDRENPLDCPGFVMIDEIDQHLHPRWQATIIERLRAAFPHLQFLVTTHSPLVVSQLQDGVYLLANLDGEVTADPVADTYGADVNSILEVIMQAPERQLEVKTTLAACHRATARGDLPTAEASLQKLERLLRPDHPETAHLHTLIESRRRLLNATHRQAN